MIDFLVYHLSTHGEDWNHEDDVTEEFADGGPQDYAPYVGTQNAKRDGDGGSEDGQEGKGRNPRTFILDIVAGFAQTAFLDVHPTGNLLDAADTSDEVIEHGSQYIADGAADNGEEWIHSCSGEQGAHDHFGTEGDKGASKERCHRRTYIAVFYEKLIERVQGEWGLEMRV